MRKKVLQLLVDMALKRRKAVLAVSLLITALAILGASQIKIDPRWSALLPQKLDVVKEYNRIDENYLQTANMIVAVRGEDPLIIQEICDEVTSVLEEVMLADPGMSEEEMIASGRVVRHVYGRMPEEWLTRNSFALIKPREAKRIHDIYHNPSLSSWLTHLNDDFEIEYGDSESVQNDERNIVRSLDALEKFTRLLDTARAEEVSDEEIERAVRDLTVGNPYMMSLDDSMSLVLVAPAIGSDNIEALVAMDKNIEKHLAYLAKDYPGYAVERTGFIAVSRDEMDSVGPYTAAISIGALVLIFFLLVYNFRSAVVPFLALVPIIAGILWTVGFIGLTIGSLNLITMMIMVVLLGLGIDFTIHLSSRFLGETASGATVEEAVTRMIEGTGKGVVTGALTTAVAFLVLMIADVKAVSEFGYCAGFGVIITLLASIWMLPSLMVSRHLGREKKKKETAPIRDIPLIGRLALFSAGKAYIVIIVFMLLTAAGIFAGSKVQWEYNFMNLEPEGLRSVLLQDEIVEKYKLSQTTTMLTVDSVEESRKLRREFKDKSVVGEVSDISQFVSRPDFDKSIPHIKRLHAAMNEFEDSQNLMSVEERMILAEEIDRLWANMVEIQALSFTGGQDRIVEKTRQLVAERDSRDEGSLRKTADSYLDDEVNPVLLDDFARRFTRKLHEQIRVMSAVDSPVTEEMIPEKTRAQFVSTSDDGYLMTIMPTKNLYEKDELEAFRDVVTQISPRVTGTPQLILEMNQTTFDQGRVAMLFAFGVIFILLFADFKNPLAAFLTTLPLVISLALTLCVMFLFGQKLNYINMIGLPVIIGIGVDDGVHFIHRYLEHGDSHLESAAGGVGRAMLLTSLTTMIGFGSLMFYLMRGMASLGFVLFFGVGFCFLVTVVLLPALVRMNKRTLGADK